MSTNDPMLDKTLSLILTAAAFLLAGIMVAQVVLRYLFVQPFLGIEETSVLFGLWFYFLGAALATRRHRHISVDLIDIMLGLRARFWLGRARNVVTAAFGGLFTYYAIRYLITVSVGGRRSSYLDWPSGIWIASMVVGFALVTAFSLTNCLRQQGSPDWGASQDRFGKPGTSHVREAE